MGIKVRHTDIGTTAKLGLLAGQSAAAQRDIDRSLRLQEAVRREEFEREMSEFRAQLDIDAAKRSQMWQLEKMEISSRLDFERAEKERVRKLDAVDNALRQIDREVEAGRITEAQAAPIRFAQEMKKFGASVPVSLIKPPTPPKPKTVSLSEQMRAYGLLQGEELKEPGWLPKLAHSVTGGILGKEPLSEEDIFYKEMFEKAAKGIPTGTISSGLPVVKNDADFDALPSGTDFVDPEGNVRRKP
jgi:hypothetical protein